MLRKPIRCESLEAGLSRLHVRDVGFVDVAATYDYHPVGCWSVAVAGTNIASAKDLALVVGEWATAESIWLDGVNPKTLSDLDLSIRMAVLQGEYERRKGAR